jgi:hypothetical protein
MSNCNECKYYKKQFMDCATAFICTGDNEDISNCARYNNFRQK